MFFGDRYLQRLSSQVVWFGSFPSLLLVPTEPYCQIALYSPNRLIWYSQGARSTSDMAYALVGRRRAHSTLQEFAGPTLWEDALFSQESERVCRTAGSEDCAGCR